jgi:hypothetical protein
VLNCACPPSFTGTLCQTDVNECVVQPEPCPTASVCNNTYGSFHCLSFFLPGTLLFTSPDVMFSQQGRPVLPSTAGLVQFSVKLNYSALDVPHLFKIYVTRSSNGTLYPCVNTTFDLNTHVCFHVIVISPPFVFSSTCFCPACVLLRWPWLRSWLLPSLIWWFPFRILFDGLFRALRLSCSCIHATYCSPHELRSTVVVFLLSLPLSAAVHSLCQQGLLLVVFYSWLRLLLLVSLSMV